MVCSRPCRLAAVEGEGERSEDVRMDEETLERLRKAEEEAERLRRELASLRANQVRPGDNDGRSMGRRCRRRRRCWPKRVGRFGLAPLSMPEI